MRESNFSIPIKYIKFQRIKGCRFLHNLTDTHRDNRQTHRADTSHTNHQTLRSEQREHHSTTTRRHITKHPDITRHYQTSPDDTRRHQPHETHQPQATSHKPHTATSTERFTEGEKRKAAPLAGARDSTKRACGGAAAETTRRTWAS